MISASIVSEEKVKHLNIFLQQRLQVISQETPLPASSSNTPLQKKFSIIDEKPDEEARQAHKRVTSQINLLANIKGPKPSEIVQCQEYNFKPGEYLEYI